MFADYVFVELPEVAISRIDPRRLDMKDNTTIESAVVLPSGPVGPSLLKVYMPNNKTEGDGSNNLYGLYLAKNIC